MEDVCRNVEGRVARTHECRKDPLPERRGDLLVADGGLLSVHVQVKVLRSAGQEALQTSRRHTVTRTHTMSHFPLRSLNKEVELCLYILLFCTPSDFTRRSIKNILILKVEVF